MLAIFLGVCGWQMWKLNAYENAVWEAKVAHFTWECDDAISLIRQDWHNALKKETWGTHPRVLGMGEVPDLGRYREMLHLLRPTVLRVSACENMDDLKNVVGLQSLALSNCPTLQNADVLKGLTGLQMLDLSEWTALQNVNALKGLTTLQEINLTNCTALQNVDDLKDLTALQLLNLRFCRSLQNVDGIKGLTGLKELNLYSCNKIPAAALRELRAALPNTDITFPDGTKNPPQ